MPVLHQQPAEDWWSLCQCLIEKIGHDDAVSGFHKVVAKLLQNKAMVIKLY